ncbi:MAG TPA: protoporphyrinogen oxidase [Bryobacteraceae bacterium]
MDPVLIVGGGISGLSMAYYLSQAGISSILFEKTTRLGGLIQTDVIQGCRLEAGPDSYLAAKPAIKELARDLPALESQIISSNDAARRVFVARDGRLLPLPAGMVMMTPGKWPPILRSDLLSARTKARLIREVFRKPRKRTEDISVGELVEDHFGSEVLELIAAPLLSGVYGGQTTALSAASVLPRFLAYEEKYGSLIRGARRELRQKKKQEALFQSFRDGMQVLPDSLARAAAGHLSVVHAEVDEVKPYGSVWQIRAGEQTLSSPNLVLACPAHVCSRLLENSAVPLAEALSAIPYSSSILVTLVYDRAALGHPLNGFGFLVPASERNVLAAATWINVKFPIRIPPHLAALRGFIVGDEATQLLTASDADIIELVRQDFSRWMGADAQPLFSTIHRWPNSMPQYVVGHSARCARIKCLLDGYPGLFLGGNACYGVGIPDCIRDAQEISKQVAARCV